ncbi:MAG: sn-glycerol-1-phosphate dehydrogenase [Oscillospiraceae bacterium]|nr:sn-glycerol-1-phosphate dehydrogenase [Oscillospiraceae bacterium]
MVVNGAKCRCGKVHTCGLKTALVRENAIAELGALAAEYHKIVYVADKNTDAVCGAAVRAQVAEKLAGSIVYPDEGFLVPNESAVERLEAVTPPDADLLLGGGSGVIQDLCKYVSFGRKLPYFVVATAPSMDGYASSGAAMIMGGMKITYAAHVPEVILGDVNVLKDAPMDMIRAGYGDILGKFSCLNDWKLAVTVNGEYFCQEVYDMMYGMLLQVKDLGPELLARKPAAIAALTEALIGAGVAMAYAGNSRPASGSEHHLSHFFEVVGLLRGEPYFLHGIDVAYSAVVTEKLREKLLAKTPTFTPKPFDRAAWEAEIRRVYGTSADGVIALQNRLGWHEQDRTAEYREKWDAICSVLREVPSSDELQRYLDSVELPPERFTAQYGDEKLADAIRCAMDLKDRYSVLWLYNALEG